jgi:hypothetical protein
MGCAYRVERRLLAAQVRLPHVSHSAVGCFVLLNHDAVVALANEVGGDETRGAVHLGDLVREHVTVVVVSSHAEASTGPPARQSIRSR